MHLLDTDHRRRAQADQGRATPTLTLTLAPTLTLTLTLTLALTLASEPKVCAIPRGLQPHAPRLQPHARKLHPYAIMPATLRAAGERPDASSTDVRLSTRRTSLA